MLRWCEENEVDYVIGLAKNDRLKREIENERLAARMFYRDNRQPARLFKCFAYKTHKSWSQKRTVVAKAEHLSKGENPRFVVTSLALARSDPQALYEQLYCARGEMENRIKEQQLMLFADRTSAHTMRANPTLIEGRLNVLSDRSQRSLQSNRQIDSFTFDLYVSLWITFVRINK